MTIGSGECSEFVGSADELLSAIGVAEAGDTVCLESGSYGDLQIGAQRSEMVTVRPVEQFGASFGSIVLDHASHIRFEGLVVDGRIENLQDSSHDIEIAGSKLGGVFVQAPSLSEEGPGPSDWVIEYNDIVDCASFCVALVSADPAAYWPVSDMTVRGNKMGPMAGGEDAIRIHNWRSVVIEDNEIFGVIETGDHNDCLQTVWGGEGLVVRGNYLHDNNCQTFFLKDGYVEDAVFEENLSVRNRAGDAPVVAQIWASANVVFRNNTLWDESALNFRSGAYSDVFTTGPNVGHLVVDNVISQFVPYDDFAEDTNRAGIYKDPEVLVEDRNVLGGGWTWIPGSVGAGSLIDEAPSFINATSSAVDDLAEGDWRLSAPVTGGNGDSFTPGISWKLHERVFGIDAYSFAR